MKSKFKKIFDATLLAGMLSGVLWLASADVAHGVPPFSKLIDYYSNDTFTNLVHTCFRTCDGFFGCHGGGQKTAYQVREFDWNCPGGDGSCCVTCVVNSTRVPCPQHILNNYPCPECSSSPGSQASSSGSTPGERRHVAALASLPQRSSTADGVQPALTWRRNGQGCRPVHELW